MDPKLKDFRNFVYLVWKHLQLPDPTPIQYDIASYLQNGPRRRCIQAFRGVGKTWLTVAFVCWSLLMDPQKKILVVSASKEHANNFTTFCLRLIYEIPELQHLRPTSEQRCSKVSFDVAPSMAAAAPSVKSLGITSQLAGNRADIIVPDDIETLTNSATQTMRDKISEAVKEFDAILKPDGQIVYLGTPQIEGSLYSLLPSRGYDVRIWPARYPNDQEQAFYGDSLAQYIVDKLQQDPSLVGRSTDTKRFDDQDLSEREASYGRSGFQLQFMLNTNLSDAQRFPLKVADLVVMSLNPDHAPQKVIWASSPELIHHDLPNVALNGDYFYNPMQVSKEDWLPWSGSVMFIDPAGRGLDETAWAIVKMLHGTLYLVDSGGLQQGYTKETLEHLASRAKLHKVNLVQYEANFGDGMFGELLEPVMARIYPCIVEEVKVRTQKERRIIDVLEPVLNQHRLVVDRSVILRDWESTKHHPPELAIKYQLFYQLTHITSDRGSLRHDDRLDALAGAVAYWTQQMDRDVDRAMDAEKQKRLDKELKRFLRHSTGRAPQKPGAWIARR